MKPLLVRDVSAADVPACSRDIPVRDNARFLLDHNVEAVSVLIQERYSGYAVVTAGEHKSPIVHFIERREQMRRQILAK